MKVALILVFLFSPAISMAESNPPRKTTHVNFDAELVEGKLLSPELTAIFTENSKAHGRLIKLRDNFTQEMVKTAEVIRTAR